MPLHANLDALILREDLEINEDADHVTGVKDTISASDLEIGHLTYLALRKPDFQRETSAWEPEKVAALVQSFIEGDLIPSVILWKSPNGGLFILDGAHRLGAIIAWVNDDYGDGPRSMEFFQHFVSDEQRKTADKTRQLIRASVGSYLEIRGAATSPMTATDEHKRFALNLGSNSIVIQWVKGTAAKAEASYFKINQGAARIDPTELKMIKARRRPNALAARALMRAGTGHKYWSAFDQAVRDEIEQIAYDVYNVLFRPALQTQTIKTLDVPVAGRGYTADSFTMIFALVNFVNRADTTGTGNGTKGEPPDDIDGSATIAYLKAVRRAATRISGGEPGSLGLHPLVYFYGATGRFQPTAFLATVAFVRELETRNGFAEFTSARYRFEEFLHRYRHFMNQIGRSFGSLERGLSPMLTMYRTMLSAIKAEKTDEQIIEELQTQEQLKSLKPISDEDRQFGKNFSKETATTVFLRDAMESAIRCKICNARLHGPSISMDHIETKQDGGLGTPDNLQMTHPYCNTGYKTQKKHRATKGKN